MHVAVSAGMQRVMIMSWQSPHVAVSVTAGMHPCACVLSLAHTLTVPGGCRTVAVVNVGMRPVATPTDSLHTHMHTHTSPPSLPTPTPRLLQGRIFSYQDTQRYRIGTNFQMLPVNAPQCPFHLNNINGAMNFSHREGNVNYYPSHREHAREAERFPVSQQRHEGPKTKQRIEKENNFQQAGERWRSWDHGRQQRFVKHFCEKLCDPRRGMHGEGDTR